MSFNVYLNGIQYSVPNIGDTNWGSYLNQYLQALSQYTFQPNSGLFTLSADAYFGPTYGVEAAYFTLPELSSTPSILNNGYGKIFAKTDGNLYWVTPSGSVNQITPSGGSVTSVGLSLPNIFTVTNSPVTSSGTLTASFNSQTDGYVFAAPAGVGSGTPTFRSLVSSDIPSLSTSILTSGTLPVTRGGTGLSTLVNHGVLAASSSTAISQTNVNTTSTNWYLSSANSGFPTFQQIAFGDLSGTATLSQISSSGASSGNVITYNGSSIVWGSGGGTLTGSGVANQVALWNGTSSLDGYSNFTFNNSNGNLTVDGYLTLNYNAANTVIIGSGTTNSTGAQAVVIGYNNSDVGGGGENVVIGSTSSAFGSGSGNIAIGNLAATGQSNGSNAIAIGYKAGYAGGSTSAVGQNSVAIGTLTTVTGLTGVAIGYSATNTGGSGVAIGNTASSSNASIALGSATASGTNSIAIGTNTGASTTDSTALGYNALVNYANSTALGYSATATASNQVVLGTSAESIFNPGGVLQFGGITSSYPSLRYSGNQLQVRLADNSGDGYFKSGTQTVDGYIALQNQTTTPSANAGFGTLYVKNSDGNLYYVSGTGSTTQLTPSSGSGTVTSVAMTVPSFLSVSGSPITGSGTLAVSLSGTALPIANGGTAITSWIPYSLVVGNSSNALAQISNNSSATNEYLRQVNGTIPSWQQIPFSDLSGTATLSQISTSGASTGNVITYNGTSVVWSAGGGGISGSGTSGQLTYWNGSSSVTGNANLTWTNPQLLIDGYVALQPIATPTSSVSNGQLYAQQNPAEDLTYQDAYGVVNQITGYDYRQTLIDDDFLFTLATNPGTGTSFGTNWLAYVSGTGAAISVPGNNAVIYHHPGTIQLQTGTTATGVAQMYGPGQVDSIVPGDWQYCAWICMIPTLSNGTNTFTVSCGTTNTASGGTMSNGISFQYTNGTNSGAWTVNVGGTIINTSVTVVAGTWYRVAYTLDAACANLYWYITPAGGSTVSGHSTSSLPTAGSGAYHLGAFITKTVGTTSSVFNLDRAYYRQLNARS